MFLIVFDRGITPSKRKRRLRRAFRSQKEVNLYLCKICDRHDSALTIKHNRKTNVLSTASYLLRKEVIQPHLPVRLPCYDFTPITDPTFDGSFLTVGPPASGVADFRGVTGGVYKARERIHPGNADPGLLATPTSRSRVADFDPN